MTEQLDSGIDEEFAAFFNEVQSSSKVKMKRKSKRELDDEIDTMLEIKAEETQNETQKKIASKIKRWAKPYGLGKITQSVSCYDGAYGSKLYEFEIATKLLKNYQIRELEEISKKIGMVYGIKAVGDHLQIVFAYGN